MARLPRRKPKLNSDGTPRPEIAEGVHPSALRGLTEGLSPDQIVEREGAASPGVDGVGLTSHLAEVKTDGSRVPIATMVVTDSLDEVWTDGTDRLQRGDHRFFPKEVWRAIVSGYICLRCLERQDESFPPAERAVHLPGCSYDIAGRQAMDCAMEFEGEQHLGPGKPISEYLLERDVEQEKRRHDAELAAGGSPMRGVRRG